MHRTINVIYAATAALIFAGCLQEPAEVRPKDTSSGTDLEAEVERDPATGVEYIVDRSTGDRYLLNPGRERLTKEPKALAKGQPQISEWMDWSKTVITRIYRCSATGQHVSVGCQVDADFVVVGGGAYADYGHGSGALLTESRPLDATLGTWVASSKDHVRANNHTLYCYAIGLRIAGMSRADLMSNVKLTSPTSSVASHPQQGAGFPNEDYFVVGGGARANWQQYGTAGSLLTQSAPYFGNIGWYGKAKDHKVSNPASITTYAIGIRSSWFWPGSGWLDIKTLYSSGSYSAGGVGVATRDVEEEWVMTGPGGEATWTSGSAGRLLFGIRPEGDDYNRTGVYSKDHVTGSSGHTYASLVQIRKRH